MLNQADAMKGFLDRNWKWVFISLLVAAALVRLPQPEIANFNSDDEMRDYHQTLLLLDGKDRPITGPALFPYGWQGYVPGPFFYYLNLLPFSLSRNPAAGILFLNLLNVFGIGIFLVLAAKWVGRSAAFLSGVFLVASPWAILYGRSFMHHHSGFFFGMVFLYFLWRWSVERKPWSLAPAMLALALVIQVHTIYVAFLPFAVAWALFMRPRWHPGWALLGLLMVIGSYAPWWWVDAHRGWASLKSFLDPAQYAVSSQPFTPDMFKALSWPFIMLTGELSYFTRKETLAFMGFPGLTFWMGVASILSVILFTLLGLIHAVRGARANCKGTAPGRWRELEEVRALLFMAGGLGIFVLVLLARRTTAHPIYLSPVFPIGYIFLALYFTRVLPNWKGVSERGAKVITLSVVLFLSIYHVTLVQGLLRSRGQGMVYSGLSRISLNHYLDACRWIREDSGGRYRIVGETPCLPKREIGEIRPLTTFMIDYLQAAPSEGDGVSTYLAVFEEGGRHLEATDLAGGNRVKRFGPIAVIRK